MGNESLWGYVVGFAFVLWLGDSFFNERLPEISYSYPAICIATDEHGQRQQTLVSDNKCLGEQYAYLPGRAGYKAIASNQEVIKWNVDPRTPPFAYKDCAVVDRENWTCDDKGLGVTIQMIDGDYQEIGYLVQNEVFVSKWRWWFMRVTLHAMDDNDIAHLNDKP